MSALNKTMQERNMQQITAKQRVVKVFVQILLYTFLTVMAVIIIFPFYWMIISSLKDYNEFRDTVTFFPMKLDFRNYAEVFQAKSSDGGSLFSFFIHTAIIGVVSTLLSLVITVLSAFAFARLEFKGKNALFGALLATMMIPGELFTITNYKTVMDLKWENNDLALVIPFLVSVFYIYLLRQNFLQIPNELYLAAKVDGTSDIKYLWKVMIPLSYPTLISITILKMMGAWNTYKWPELVASKIPLITNGIRNHIDFAAKDPATGEKIAGVVDVPVQMAAVFLVSIPLFLVFIFLRKYIMKGVSRSGIKG